MNAEQHAIRSSNSTAASGSQDAKSKSRPVTGWAEMWAGVTCGLAVLGCCWLGRLFWPTNNVGQWLFTGVVAVVWIFGCRQSGLMVGPYDFPEGKYANLKRFIAGGIGFLALVGLVFFWDVRPRASLSNLLVALLLFLVGGFANAGRRSEATPKA